MKKNNKLATILLASSLLLPGIAPIASGVASVSAAPSTSVAAENTEYKVVTEEVIRFRTEENAKPVALVGRGDTVKFLEEVNLKWFKVEFEGKTGYILRGNLTSKDNFENGNKEIHDVAAPKEDSAESTYKVAVKTALRTADADRYKPLEILDRGTSVEYLGTTANNWFRVKADGVEGYVKREDVTKNENYDADKEADLSYETFRQEANPALDVLEASLTTALRSRPGTQYSPIDEVARGTKVTYKGTVKGLEQWFLVELEDGRQGYINRSHVTKVVEEVEEDLKVESVSAINANIVQVTMNKNVPSGLSKDNFKISNAVNVEKVTVSGKTVTLETSTLPANRDLTLSFVDVAGLENATETFKYNQTVNLETAVEGFVYVIDAAGKKVPGEDVKVTSLDGTTKADQNGYYKLPAKAGAVEVTLEYDGHYVNVQDVNVQDKKATAHVVTMDEIDADKFVVAGYVQDAKNATAIKDATVVLEEKVGNNWVKVDERKSAATTGAYAFANKGVSIGALDNGVTVAATDQFENFGSSSKVNKLKYNADYRVVVEKDGVVAADADKPYHEVIKEFNLSNKGPETTQSASLKEVAKIDKVNIELIYDATLAPENGSGDKEIAKVNYTVYDETGQKVVEGLGSSVLEATTVALTKDGKQYKATENLVGLLTDNLYLKSGKYFVKVDDGTTALQAFELNITEGKDSLNTKFEAKENATATITSSFNEIPTGHNTGITDAVLNVYEVVNGVEVLLASKNDVAYTITAGSLTTATNEFDRLAEKSYKAGLNHKYIAEAKTTTVEAKTETTKNFNVPVDAAGILTSEFNLKTMKHGTPISTITEEALGYAVLKGETPFEIIVKDGSGKEVRKEKVNLRVDASGDIQKDPNSTLQFEAGTSSNDLKVVVNKLLPADYTVTVKNLDDSFELVTNEETTVKVFEDNLAKHAKLIQTPNVYLTGSLEFTNGLKAEAQHLKVIDMSTGVDITSKVVPANKNLEDGRYDVLLEGLPKGKYKVVLYGAEVSGDNKLVANNSGVKNQFETYAKDFDLGKGTNTENIKVTKGGEAKLDLNVFDTNGARLNAGDFTTIEVRDEFGTLVDFTPVLTNGTMSSKVTLSAGDYRVKLVPASGKNLQAVSETVTIGRINSTKLETIDVPVISRGKTYKVEGTVKVSTAVQNAKVAIFNSSNGELVTNLNTGADGKYEVMLANGGYVLKAYYVDGSGNRHYVETQEVEVKDRAVSDVDFNLKEAKR